MEEINNYQRGDEKGAKEKSYETILLAKKWLSLRDLKNCSIESPAAKKFVITNLLENAGLMVEPKDGGLMVIVA